MYFRVLENALFYSFPNREIKIVRKEVLATADVVKELHLELGGR